MRKLPPESTLLDFIVATHSCDRIQLTPDVVTNTLQGKGKPSPYIQGHRKALKFICTELVGSSDFPAKDPNILINHYHSENALYWLREIHSLVMYPVAQDNLSSGLGIKPCECGTYRFKPKALAFSYAPEPDDVPILLHLWLKEVSELHSEVRTDIDNPYGINPEQSKRLVHTANEVSFFFGCLQPFEEGSNRVGRLVENTLRLHWYMPWDTQYGGPQLDEYIKKFTVYQQTRWKEYWLRKLTEYKSAK